MVLVDLGSVEDLVCYDKKLRKLLPSLNGLFQQWEASLVGNGVRKRTLADILRSLSDHMDVLNEYFAEEVRVEELDYSVVRNLKFALDRAEEAGDFAQIGRAYV